jgi:hypothetical protein
MGRRAYGVPLAACAVSAFAMAGWLQWLRGATPGVNDGIWYGAPVLGWLHAHAGLSLSMQLLLLPLACVVALAIVLVVLEAVVFAAHLDRADRSWTSLAWTIRGWRAALVWCLIVVAALAMLGGVAYLVEAVLPASLWLPIAIDWLGPLVVAFLAWNAPALAAPTPPTWWPPRWPGWNAVALGAAWIATGIAIAAIVAWLEQPGVWRTYVVVVVLAGFVAESTILVAWLNRSRLSLPEVFALVCRWRVLAPLALLELRLLVWVALLLLPILPAYLVLVFLGPSLEDALRQHPGELPARWMALVHASRFAVQWWWAISLGLIGVAKVPLMWIDAVARGRLFVELGLVEAPTEGA